MGKGGTGTERRFCRRNGTTGEPLSPLLWCRGQVHRRSRGCGEKLAFLSYGLRARKLVPECSNLDSVSYAADCAVPTRFGPSGLTRGTYSISLTSSFLLIMSPPRPPA